MWNLNSMFMAVIRSKTEFVSVYGFSLRVEIFFINLCNKNLKHELNKTRMIEYTNSFQWLQVELQWGVSKRKVKVVHRLVVHSPQTGLGCIFMAIICWNCISCESSYLLEYSSNSAYQHVCEAATYLFSFLPSPCNNFSLVVWAITRSVDRKLICGVMINIFKSTQHKLPNKNAHEILFDGDVTRCTFQLGVG